MDRLLPSGETLGAFSLDIFLSEQLQTPALRSTVIQLA
jgi:hypothetical protein